MGGGNDRGSHVVNGDTKWGPMGSSGMSWVFKEACMGFLVGQGGRQRGLMGSRGMSRGHGGVWGSQQINGTSVRSQWVKRDVKEFPGGQGDV